MNDQSVYGTLSAISIKDKVERKCQALAHER